MALISDSFSIYTHSVYTINIMASHRIFCHINRPGFFFFFSLSDVLFRSTAVLLIFCVKESVLNTALLCKLVDSTSLADPDPELNYERWAMFDSRMRTNWTLAHGPGPSLTWTMTFRQSHCLTLNLQCVLSRRYSIDSVRYLFLWGGILIH